MISGQRICLAGDFYGLADADTRHVDMNPTSTDRTRLLADPAFTTRGALVATRQAVPG